jgi:SAM-dependent methyltransferase
MPEPLDTALLRVRGMLADPANLVRAVGSGKQRNTTPTVDRIEIRPVNLKAGLHLQVTSFQGPQPTVRNTGLDEEHLAEELDRLLGEPFGNWHVETRSETVQLRVTKKGEAQVHVGPPPPSNAQNLGGNDRAPEHLIHPDDPLFTIIGANAAKRRQVDAFLRALSATIPLSELTGPLHIVDLGCGNAYLTFAAYRFLHGLELDVTVTGVDIRDDQRARNTALAQELGYSNGMRFVSGTITDVDLPPADIVLALHACDTATDDALARAIEWKARWVLAAPCCHHDIASQLKAVNQVSLLTKDPIVRERFADVLTDALRAELLRHQGYEVDVVEFIDSTHTPKNLLIKATRHLGSESGSIVSTKAYDDLKAQWAVTPYLETLLLPQIEVGAAHRQS